MKFRTKTIESIIDGAKTKSLPKTFGAFDLVLLGIGCTIGTGIFVLTGIAAAESAGPAVTISYLISGFACILAGLAYTELAAVVPVAGGAYTYSYAILGEFVAWLVACGLFLGYTISAATVSAGWSGYFVGMLKAFGVNLPDAIIKTPSDGGIINLPAVLIAVTVGLILVRGTKESIILNRVLVAIKLLIIFIFLFVAFPHIKVENWTNNFMPFGFDGVIAGAATVFFAYIGFDSVATAAEETKNPSRDLPIGIIGSLLACAVLYITVSLALTGIVSYTELNNAEPMAYALRVNGSSLGSALIAVGAVVGMIAVLLVLIYGQSRFFFVMSRDGLIPPIFSKMHKKFNTPYINYLIITTIVCLVSGFTPIKTMGNMTSFGILFAFITASICVMVLRVKRPELKRSFKCPAVFVVAPLAILVCGYLLFTLIHEIAVPLLFWLAISLIIYFSYGYRKSPMRNI
jgi:APA family basic amino acid/polyamine antiporter